MSLKSFDKFCENMIMGKPVEQKDLFDERQNQLRSKLASQALYSYAIMSFLWVLLCDSDVRIFNSTVYGLVILMAASYLVFVVRGLKNGCVLGVKYASTKNSAILVCVEALFLPLIIFLNRDDEITDFKSFFVAEDCLTDMCALIVAAVLLLIASVMILVAAVRKDREAAADSE